MPPDSSLATLLAIPASAVPDGVAEETAGLAGVDSHRLKILLKSRGLTVLARAQAEGVSQAAESLKRAGVRCAAVSTPEVQDAPPAIRVGGIATDASGRVQLRAHGSAAGPPAGAPLLLIFGDLSRAPDGPAAFTARKPDTFVQRVLRAGAPVVDVVWPEGRLRIAPRRMTWAGLPGRTFSAPSNLALVLRRLSEQAAGVVIDDGFDGQEMSMGPLLVAGESLEGIDRERATLFERYALASIAAWRRGVYFETAPGRVSTATERDVPAADFFSRRPAPPKPASIPWIRSGARSRVRPAWSILFGLPVLGVLFGYFREPASGLFIGALVIGGGAGLYYGLRALRRRERLRALFPSRIRSMALGAVQLSGRVVGCMPLAAPYSRVRCGWYRLELRQTPSDEEGGGRWNGSAERAGSGDLPFWLEDETAAVLIQPAGAEVEVEPCVTVVSEQTEAVEWILAEGQTVFVDGFAQRRSTDSESVPPLSGRNVPERDEVFVGSTSAEPMRIRVGTRAGEQSSMTKDFLVGVVVGGLYLLAAVWLLIQKLST